MAHHAYRTRRATLEDESGIWPLVKDFATSFQPHPPQFHQAFHRLLGRDDSLVLVAEHPSFGVIGYLLGSCHDALFSDRPIAWIEEVMVGLDFRRTGVGRALMAEAEKWAQERGVAYVSLATRRASIFYQSLAYEESAIFYRKLMSATNG